MQGLRHGGRPLDSARNVQDQSEEVADLSQCGVPDIPTPVVDPPGGDAEVGNALRSMVRRGDLTDGVGASARLMAERLVHRRHPIHGAISGRAWQLRHSLSFYDALYIALAESLHYQLITADSRIARAFKDHDLISTITPDG